MRLLLYCFHYLPPAVAKIQAESAEGAPGLAPDGAGRVHAADGDGVIGGQILGLIH